ncbi:conserved protein of unknown function [Cupriavidus taiwanensis]|nr:conserved protein of unknown function [Cupriavidus taiwanensis]
MPTQSWLPAPCAGRQSQASTHAHNANTVIRRISAMLGSRLRMVAAAVAGAIALAGCANLPDESAGTAAAPAPAPVPPQLPPAPPPHRQFPPGPPPRPSTCPTAAASACPNTARACASS